MEGCDSAGGKEGADLGNTAKQSLVYDLMAEWQHVRRMREPVVLA